jgi:hypothetical protein
MPPVDNRDDPSKSPDPAAFDPLEPDWYGWRARQKRKNEDAGTDHPRRTTTERLLALASALSALAVIVIGLAIIVGILTQPLLGTRLITATPALLATAPLPTRPTLTLEKTVTARPRASASPARLALPQITEFTDSLGMIGTIKLGNPLPGAVLRGLAIGPTKLLFAARTINAGVDMLRCDPGEAYLILDRAAGQVGTIGLPQMVAPKAIAFDSAGRIFILAHFTEDCKSFTQAIFAFGGLKGGLSGLFRFESLVADALLITPDNRIFVTLSGFAGGGDQKHLIELRWDDPTGAFTQIQDYGDDVFDARYNALATVDQTLIMVRMRTGEPCSFRTLSLQTAPTIVDPARSGTFAAPLDPTPTVAKVQGGPSIPDQACPAVLSISQHGPGMQLIGLSVVGNTAARLSVESGAAQTYFTLPIIRPTGFVIDPANGHWFIASANSGP